MQSFWDSTRVALILLTCSIFGNVVAAERPNIVMIVSDDHAWNDYGFMGHAEIQTPNLDRLASESLTFTRGYVPSSLCRPSLMTMITGLYPHQHRIVGNDPPRGTDRSEMLKHVRRLPTLPKILAAQGYQCLQTGKWWEGNFAEGGFTSGMSQGNPANGGRHGDKGLAIGRQGLQPIYDFVEASHGQPFFVWYAPMMPHSPHTPPKELLDKYQSRVSSLHLARYYAMVEWFDRTCGELLDFLAKKQLRENTLVVYVTDNGWLQSLDKPQFAERSKRSPYEGGVRTPIMLSLPKRIKAIRDDETLASSIDLMPTILAACGIQPPADLPGVNLLNAEQPKRDILFGEIFDHDVADIDNPQASLQFRWCINDQWKLIVPNGEAPPQLYRIRSDPAEKEDVASQNSDVVKGLAKSIEDWWPMRKDKSS